MSDRKISERTKDAIALRDFFRVRERWLQREFFNKERTRFCLLGGMNELGITPARQARDLIMFIEKCITRRHHILMAIAGFNDTHSYEQVFDLLEYAVAQSIQEDQKLNQST